MLQLGEINETLTHHTLLSSKCREIQNRTVPPWNALLGLVYREQRGSISSNDYNTSDESCNID